ncbi:MULTISPECIES: efflux RND transporter periplasmic adaptor subunit [Labrys]|uniref:Efflux RND transporter periplasmic adaptor subunit n=1 Tax=Labrys neptuniae TaxID=376174 RepID=A0ABV3PNE1_9HYPH
MKNAKAIMGLAGLAILAGMTAAGWTLFQARAAVTPAPIRPAPSVVVSQPLQMRVVDTQEFAGRFQASAMVEIRARVPGYLDAINFEDGQLVEKGRVLFVVDQRTYQASLDMAKAQLKSAGAQADLAGQELERARQLAGTAAVSRSTLDQRLQQKAAADAAIETAQATLRRAELDLEFATIRAPIAGRVSNRRLDVGSLVSDSGTVLTTIVALDPIDFVFDMSERDFLRHERAMKAGAMPSMRDKGVAVQARPDGETGWSNDGVLSFVDNRLEPGAGTIRARATLANPSLAITPGQFGRVRMAASGDYPALLIPETAVLTDQASRIVLKLGADSTLQAATVGLGPSRPDGLRVVTSGLGPDDRIVVNGLLRARPGQKVAPQPGSITTQTAGLAE